MIKLSENNPFQFRLLTIFIMAPISILLLIGFNNFGSKARLINDYYDRADYAKRGVWILTGQVPYRDIPNEYPQIPVGLFGMITWLAKNTMPSTWPVAAGFAILWPVFMMIVFLLALWQMFQLLPVGRKKYAWLLMLPSVIYFSLNRFDILPVYLGLIIFKFIRDRRFMWATLFLAIGVFTKWYLGLTLPFILAYEFNLTRRLPWKSLLIFIVMSIIILFPTYLLGGIQAILQPYTWHLGRPVEPGTLLWFIKGISSFLAGDRANLAIATTIFTGIQFMGILSLFITRMDSFKKVILASSASILVFIVFSRIYSPQWWLWALPFLILCIDTKTDIILIIIYDILNYLTFPIVYDLTGRESPLCLSLNAVELIILSVLATRSLIRLGHLANEFSELDDNEKNATVALNSA